jgi:hypothetical protein
MPDRVAAIVRTTPDILAALRAALAVSHPGDIPESNPAARVLDSARILDVRSGSNVEIVADKSACIVLTALTAAAVSLWDLGEIKGDESVYFGLEEAKETITGAYDEIRIKEDPSFKISMVGDICFVEDSMISNPKSRSELYISALDTDGRVSKTGGTTVFYQDAFEYWFDVELWKGRFVRATPLPVSSREQAEAEAKRRCAEMEQHRYENHIVPGLEDEI